MPGLLVALFAKAFLKAKVHRNGYSFIVEFSGDWGGLNLGAVSFCGGYTTKCQNLNWFEHTRRHEFGHSLQNIVFGPFQIFLVAIPSAIRYHYQMARMRKGLPNKEYDSIWFEGTATKLGTWAIARIEGEK